MKKIATNLLLIALTMISASAQNPLYKGGEVIKINDSLTLECIKYSDKFIGLNIQSPVNIRRIHDKSLSSVPGTTEFMLKMSAVEDLEYEKNASLKQKIVDIFCNALTPEQFQLFTVDSARSSFFLVWVYYNSSDGSFAAADISLIKDKPVFIELPPQVYGKFIEQIKREIKLVDVKYKLTPYISASYPILRDSIVKRYPELHK